MDWERVRRHTHEERAILDAAPAHIDLEAFRFYLQRLGFDTTNDPQPDSEDDLRNRGVLTDIDGRLRATLYGVLAFARDPQRYARTRNFRWVVFWSGLGKPASVSTPPVNPEELEQTGCCIRRASRSIRTPVSRLFARCTTCDSANPLPSAALSISFPESKAPE